MISKDSVGEVVREFLLTGELYLVDLKITLDNRIMIEIDSFEGVSVENCVQLTRHIESKFDREVEDYELEVSSAGLTSPFKVLQQYQKNVGNEVEVLSADGIKHTGILAFAGDEEFGLTVEKTVKPEGAKRKTMIQEELLFSYKNIKTTKLIIRFK